MPVPVPEHPVPTGPLAVRFLSYERTPMQAGTSSIVSVELENAGSAGWEPQGRSTRHFLSYHWLDRLGNPLVWDGLRTPLPNAVAPGERVLAWLRVVVPMPPGPYRLAIDLVDEQRFWLAEVGNRPLELDVDVLPRLTRRALAVRIAGEVGDVAATRSALAGLDEAVVEEDPEAVAFLAAGCTPAPDWSRRILDAHAEGHALVAGSIEVTGSRLGRRSIPPELAAWQPGFGRAPSWSGPLLCPSVLAGLEAGVVWAEPVAGLPAADPGSFDDTWLCDGRIRVAIDLRAPRRGDRRSA